MCMYPPPLSSPRSSGQDSTRGRPSPLVSLPPTLARCSERPPLPPTATPPVPCWMCIDCLVQVQPERGRLCLESGAYALNFARCSACKQRAGIHSHSRREQEDDDDDGDYEQTIHYSRQPTASASPLLRCSAGPHPALTSLSSACRRLRALRPRDRRPLLLLHGHAPYASATRLLSLPFSPLIRCARGPRFPHGLRAVRPSG